MKNDEKSISLSQGVFIQAGGMLSWIISPFTALYSLCRALLIISLFSLSCIILTIALRLWRPRTLDQTVNNADYAIAYIFLNFFWIVSVVRWFDGQDG